MTIRKTFNTQVGADTVIPQGMAYVRPHWVSRSDKVYSVKSYPATLGELDVEYYDSVGWFRFAQPFNEGEKINVVYEV